MRVQMILEAIDKASTVIEGVRRAATAANADTARSAEKAARAQRGATDAVQGLKSLLRDATAGFSLRAVISQAMEFEYALAQVQKIVETTPDKLAGLGTSALRLSREIPLAATEILKLMEFGARLRLPVERLEEFARIAATMGFAWDMTAEQAGKALSGLMSIFKRDLAGAAALADAINALSNAMDAAAPAIANILQRAGAAGVQLGLAGEQVAALGATFTALKTAPEVAATAMNALFTTLAIADKQGPKFQAALAAIGLSAQALKAALAQDAQGAIVDLLARLAAAGPQMQGLLVDLFGRQHADEIGKLVAGLDQYRRALAIASDQGKTAGSMSAEAAVLFGTAQARWLLMQNALKAAVISFAIQALPAISGLLDVVTPVITAIGVWAQANPRLAATLTMVVAGALALRVALAAIGWLVPLQGLALLGRALVALVPALRLLAGAGLAAIGGFVQGFVSGLGGAIAAAGGMKGVLAALALRFAGLRLAAALAVGVVTSQLAALGGAALAGLAGLPAALAAAARAFLAFSGALAATPLGRIVTLIGLVAAGAVAIHQNWDQIGPRLGAALGGARDAIAGWWQEVRAGFAGLSWSSLVPPFAWADILPKWDWSAIIPPMPDLSGWIPDGVRRLFGGGPAPAVPALPPLAQVAATREQAEAAKRAVDALAPAAQQALGQVAAVLAAADFHGQGVRLMATLAAGIRAGAAAAVAAARDTVQRIRDHLPHSPAKVGPLADLDRVQFGQTLAQAITAGSPAAVGATRALAAGLLAALPAALPAPALAGAGNAAPSPAVATGAVSGGGAAGPVTVHATFQLNGTGGAGDFEGELRRALPRLSYELGQLIDAELKRRARTQH